MRHSIVAVAAIILLTAPAWAQDGNVGTLAQKRADGEELNNGTNPTILSTIAGIQYTYNEFANSSRSSSLWEALAAIPFGPKKQFQLTLTTPYADSALDSDFGLGDISLKFTHVVDVNASRGIAYTAELFLDTADRPDLGTCNRPTLNCSCTRKPCSIRLPAKGNAVCSLSIRCISFRSASDTGRGW